MSWAAGARHRSGRRLTLWGMSSYALLTVFITSFLFLGLLYSGQDQLAQRKPRIRFPDFDRVNTFTRVLSEDDVSLADRHSRVMVIGDIHGMNESLHGLLDKLSYDPSHDTIFFAGDLLAKSTHSSSLAVIDYLTKNHEENGRQTIFPVRGNHDQLIVQWRSWRDWFEEIELPLLDSAQDTTPSLASAPLSYLLSITRNSIRTATHTVNVLANGKPEEEEDSIPPVYTGRAFLRLLEHEWYATQLTGQPPDPEEYTDVARKRARGTWREAWWARIPLPGKGRAKQQWLLFGDHYWLAKDLNKKQQAFLESLPLVNHIPHLHLFVVHAGLLPANPKWKADDQRQPLATVPTLGKKRRGSKVLTPVKAEVEEDERDFFSRIRQLESQTTLTSIDILPLMDKGVNASMIAVLRHLQEAAIVTDVPPNRDPWVVLNMRSVKKNGKVTRNGDKGRPWSDIWAEMMGKCGGFGLDGEDYTEEESEIVATKKGKGGKDKDYELLCYPTTVVYGHAASRGLDIKRWSFGLDTGCLYGNKLTSLVLRRAQSQGDDEDDEDELSAGVLKKRRIQFGDKAAGIQANLVSVRCPNVDGSDDDDHDHDDDHGDS